MTYNICTTKKLLSALFIIANCHMGLTQDQKTTIPMKKWETTFETINHQNGFILKVCAPQQLLKEGSPIYYYSDEGKPLWSRTLYNHYKSSKRTEVIVSAPDGSIIYNIEMERDAYSKEKHYVTQISDEGVVKTFQVEGKQKLGKELQAIFCDSNYLYYLATEKGAFKKKPRLMLARFRHGDFSYKKLIIDLPKENEGTFWAFMGQQGDEKYLVSKTNEMEESKHLFDILVFDQSGQIKRSTRIDYKPDDFKFVRPARTTYFPQRSFYVAANYDAILQSGTTGGSIDPTHYNYYGITNGGYSNLQLDEAHHCFYAFGLFGPKPFKVLGPLYEGFYIYKYDLSGKLLWRFQQTASEELLSHGRFRVHNRPGDRIINLKTLLDQTLNFSIQFNKSLFTYEISPDGKFVGILQNDDVDDPRDEFIYNSSISLRGTHWIENVTSRRFLEFKYNHFMTTKGEVLLRISFPDDKIDVLFFNHYKEE